MLCQATRKNIGQLRQEAETTLPGLDALVFELLVQGLDNAGNLQCGKTKQKETHRSSQLPEHRALLPKQLAQLSQKHQQHSKKTVRIQQSTVELFMRKQDKGKITVHVKKKYTNR